MYRSQVGFDSEEVLEVDMQLQMSNQPLDTESSYLMESVDSCLEQYYSVDCRVDMFHQPKRLEFPMELQYILGHKMI